jgi:hypothetical protein
MGCKASKDVEDRPASTFAGTAVEKMTGALDALNNNRTSVIDQIYLAKQMVATGSIQHHHQGTRDAKHICSTLGIHGHLSSAGLPKDRGGKGIHRKGNLAKLCVRQHAPLGTQDHDSCL